MGSTLNRNFGPVGDLRTGEFTRETENGRAALSCPLCGAVFELPPGFVPDPTGKLNYALTCRGANPCPFFDWVTLADHWLDP